MARLMDNIPRVRAIMDQLKDLEFCLLTEKGYTLPEVYVALRGASALVARVMIEGRHQEISAEDLLLLDADVDKVVAKFRDYELPALIEKCRKKQEGSTHA